MKGDADAVATVQSHKCVTIDGCPKACARKSVELAGACPSKAVQVVEFLKAHRGAQPGTAAMLTSDGWAVCREIAQTVADAVVRLQLGEEVAP